MEGVWHHRIRKGFKHLYHHYGTRQAICQMLATIGMYFEILIGIPLLITIYYLLYHKASKHCMTVANWFCGPDFELLSKVKEFDPYAEETRENKRNRRAKHAIINGCGKDYIDFVSSKHLNGTQSEKYLQAGQQYWDVLVHYPDKVFRNDFLQIWTMWLIAACTSLLLNALLNLAIKMKGEGDKKALMFVSGATLLPMILISTGVILLQHGKYCILDYGIPNLGIRKLAFGYMIFRLVQEGLKLFLIWRVIRSLVDKLDHRLQARNKRFDSAFYHEMGVEAELHLTEDELGRIATVNEEDEEMKKSKMLATAVKDLRAKKTAK